jgi:uncharacterized protein (DUF2141 family)
MRKSAALVLAAPLITANARSATLEVGLSGLRNSRGLIHACLTAKPAHFPDCESDPSARKESVPGNARELLFRDVPPGRYALAVFHDANANRRLDTFMGIPREGFGFSRNPVIRFGAPRFDKVNINLSPGFTRTSVTLQYLL